MTYFTGDLRALPFSLPDGGTDPSLKPPAAAAPAPGAAAGCPTGCIVLAYEDGKVADVLYEEHEQRLYTPAEATALIAMYRETPECAGESYTVVEVTG